MHRIFRILRSKFGMGRKMLDTIVGRRKESHAHAL